MILTPRVLSVVSSVALAKAMAHVLGRRGFSVDVVTSTERAMGVLTHYDCAVLADELPNALATAGWLLANGRADSVVFYGSSMDEEQRLRSANLGSHVHASEGLHRLSLVISDAIEETRLARAAGAEDPDSFRPEARTGPRRRR